MAQTTQEPLGKAEQMLVDMIDGEPIVETPDNKIQGLLMELADVIAQGGGGGGGGGVTKYAQLPDKPRINDVELSGNKSFSQLGLNIQNTPVNGSNDPISSGGVYNALADKVTKETGKSLTSNDFTNALLAKLNAIESGAQVNLIEKILVNGVEVAPSNKAVALTVMTNTVENLVNYYKKSETYSQAEVDQLISQISGGITLEVVEELPETGISTSTIYLIEAGENVYTQYLYSSVDEEWKILGSTTVDLSNYYTKTQVDTLLAGKQNTLEYDNAPTASSEKMVKSGGIYNALQGKQDTLEYDNTPTEDSQKMVKSGAIWEALEGKQDTLEWDSVPTAGSTKSLTSGAIKTALDGLDAAGKADKVEGATDGDLAALDENGNLTDSGSKASDFLTEHQDVSGKADKVESATDGNLAGLDANGNLTDSGKSAANVVMKSSTAGLLKNDGSVDETEYASAANLALKANQAEVNMINNLLGAKNLLPSGAKRTVLNGITFSINADGSINVSGTATADARIAWYFTRNLPAGKYTLGKVVYNAETTGGIGNFAIMNRPSGTIANVKEISFSGSETTDFTLTNSVIFTEAAIYVKSGTTVNLRVHPYVYEENTKDQSYTQYVPSNSEVLSHAANSFLGAKNLLPNENTPATSTQGNVTFTKQADGTIKTNGGITASADAIYVYRQITDDILLPPGRYIISGCPDGGAEGTYCFYIHFRNADNSGWAEYYINGGGDTLFTVPDDRKQYITIRIRKNTVIPAGGFTFKPMIRLAEDSDAIYRPYAMTNRELTVKSNALELDKASATHFSVPAGSDVSMNFKTKHGYQRFLVFAYAGAWEAVILVQMKYHITSASEINIYTTDNTKSLSPVFNSSTSLTLTFAAQGQYDIISAEPFEIVS